MPNSLSLQRLIAIIDPSAAEKVAAVLLERDRHKSVSSTGSATAAAVGNYPAEEVRPGTDDAVPEIGIKEGKRGQGKKKLPSPLKRLLQKQDSKRRTILYVACAAGDTGVADALLAAGASTDGHGAWQRTPLHIAAFEGHTSVVRTLLGAGADPWTMNGRGQTPTDVSNMYNANGEVLELLEQAVDMRRVISTGAKGLVGATFVDDDGQVGIVADLIEQWAFTVEVELDHGKTGSAGGKVCLPVRGQRRNSPPKPSSDSFADSTSCNSASSAHPLPRRWEQSIPWSAKTIGRMRLESDGLLRVNADSLIGATARTSLGPGRVIAVRDVSIRCELETVTANKIETVTVTQKAGDTTYNGTGDETDVDAAQRQLGTSVKETKAYRQSRTTKNGIFTPGVMQRGLFSNPGSEVFNEGHGTEAISRAKRRGEGHEDGNHGQIEQRDDHAMASSGGPERCLDKRVVHLASRQGVPGEKSGARRWVAGDHSWDNDGDDDDENNYARDDCSVGTEKAAGFDEHATIAVNENTQGDFGPEHIGAGSWRTHDGASPQGTGSHTRQHAFLDNLVPFATFEGILDFKKLPPSATTPRSRARRRRLLCQWNNRMSVSPSTAKASSQDPNDTPRHWPGDYSWPSSPSSPSSPTPTSVTLDVDDLFYLSVGQRASLDSTGDIVGLEEQIEREERSEGRMESKRAKMEATRMAVCETLLLWSSKADLLQAKLVVLRTVASSTASTVSGSGTSTVAHTTTNITANITNTMSLEEYLASPSPRCCACNTRGGYRQESLATSTSVPASDMCPTITTPAALKTNVAADRRSMHDSQITTEGRGSSLQSTNVSCRENGDSHGDLNNNSGADGAVNGDATDTLLRERRLIAHLEECLKCMTHLRDWLRLLDHEIGLLSSPSVKL